MLTSRTPQGVRGLKYGARYRLHEWRCSRTPQGVRGLKLCQAGFEKMICLVAPRKGCVD